MYKKYLIVASKQDLAGINITTSLSQFDSEKFNFYLLEQDILHEENLDIEKINSYDFIIFASKHVSKERTKTLSIHAPGNINEAKFGGKEKQLSPTSALFQKQLFQNIDFFKEKFNLKNYKLTLESTHHGPLISKPCVFIEIGSTETEWKDRKASFVIAKAISKTINSFKENPYNEVAIGIGGNHYCDAFNKLQLKSNIALSYIFPKYTFPLSAEIIKQSIEETDEEVELAVLDWKGLGDAESKKEILKLLDSLYIQHEKVSEIKNRTEMN